MAGKQQLTIKQVGRPEGFLNSYRRPFCALATRASDQPIFGSAPHVNCWLLLEYNQAWGKKVLAQSALPLDIKSQLSSALAEQNLGKCLFIKRPEREESPLKRFYIVTGDAAAQRIYRFDLRVYEALAAIDIPAVCRGAGHYDEFLCDENLYLVCTNGKRDACCAKFGIPLYKCMQTYAGESVWQCSHFGGHMYAPTFLSLPQGNCYGQVQMEDVEKIISCSAKGEVFLPSLRGRTTFDKAAQVAEHFLRMQTGHCQEHRYALVSGGEPVNSDPRSVVHLRCRETMRLFRIEFDMLKTDVPLLKSCIGEKYTRVDQYQCRAIKEVNSPDRAHGLNSNVAT